MSSAGRVIAGFAAAVPVIAGAADRLGRRRTYAIVLDIAVAITTLQPRAPGRSQWESYAMTTTHDEQRTCERCDAPIPPARVKALPGTWLCIQCSEEVGGDFVYIAKQENLGKAGSLKLNYGGISVTKKRRTVRKKHT
jgi:hypothetical protein